MLSQCNSAAPFMSARGCLHRHRCGATQTVCRPMKRAQLQPAAALDRRGGDQTPTGGEANTILDAFFLGRAFAETVNERLGAALGDALSEITKLNAEREYHMRSFQQEVQQRADREKEQRTGLPLGTASSASGASWQQSSAPYSAGASWNGSQPSQSVTAPDVLAEVDELRAEIASARAAVQRVRVSMQQGTTAPY